uniref:Pyridine nucleotide-disulphide oxidoreductase domain 2 n=1 Tax=Homo sapiens TaxID=9606 RepID=A0A8V8TN71_HUMAN
MAASGRGLCKAVAASPFPAWRRDNTEARGGLKPEYDAVVIGAGRHLGFRCWLCCVAWGKCLPSLGLDLPMENDRKTRGPQMHDCQLGLYRDNDGTESRRHSTCSFEGMPSFSYVLEQLRAGRYSTLTSPGKNV